MKDFTKKILRFVAKNNILIIFIIFAVFMTVLGFMFTKGLSPSTNKVEEIIKKYTNGDYSIPYHVAERYLVWYNMRTFFFTLNYILTLVALVASLLTVFYASTDVDDEKRKKSNIIFLSLLSTSFTVANMFVNAGTMAKATQHAWKELDFCIMETINEIGLSPNRKDIIITEKLIEMEKYIEPYEH